MFARSQKSLNHYNFPGYDLSEIANYAGYKSRMKVHGGGFNVWIRVNDPSAGSPTETLLRLLLPLNDQV